MKKMVVFLSALCMLASPISVIANSVQIYAESETETEEIYCAKRA